MSRRREPPRESEATKELKLSYKEWLKKYSTGALPDHIEDNDPQYQRYVAERLRYEQEFALPMPTHTPLPGSFQRGLSFWKIRSKAEYPPEWTPYTGYRPPPPKEYHISVHVLPDLQGTDDGGNKEQQYQQIYTYEEQELFRKWLIAQNHRLASQNQALQHKLDQNSVFGKKIHLHRTGSWIINNLLVSSTYYIICLPMILIPFALRKRKRALTWKRLGGTLCLTLIPLFAWSLGLNIRAYHDERYFPNVPSMLRICGFAAGMGGIVHLFWRQRYLRRFALWVIPLYALNIGYNYDRQEQSFMALFYPLRRLAEWRARENAIAKERAIARERVIAREEEKAENANNEEHQQK